MNAQIILILFSLVLLNCRKDDSVREMMPNLSNAKTYNDVIVDINDELIEKGVASFNDEGAIGRNINGYFHVRFQLGMNTISDLAITRERTDALEATVKAIEYAFSYQKPEGDFELLIPEELSELGEPLEADLASGVAFFGSSLGLSLFSLSQSTWYNSPEIQPLRERITSKNEQFLSMLNYLKSVKQMLFEIDAEAPNRLLFNAVAFQSFGLYLDDNESIAIAADFANDVLQLQHDDGYFIEGGGWDSSYNGVALQLGLELYMILEGSELKTSLGSALLKAARWQTSRILSSGEINAKGNTRVFPGGEAFLGQEKGIDYAKTAKSMIYLSVLTQDDSFETLALQILDFYK